MKNFPQTRRLAVCGGLVVLTWACSPAERLEPARAAETPRPLEAREMAKAEKETPDAPATAAPEAAGDPFAKYIPGEWSPLLSHVKVAADAGDLEGAKMVSVARGTKVRVSERVEAGSPPLAWLKVELKSGGKAVSGWAPDALLAPPPQSIPRERLAEIGAEEVDRYHGISADYAPPDLVDLPKSVGYEKDRNYQLRKEPAEALKKMFDAAKAEGVTLRVVSAYRDYETQRRVYSAKLEKTGYGQTTVAKPGHSEHQLGVAVDLNDTSEEALLKEDFGKTAAGKWLLARAPEFGFAISYTPANQPKTGYSPEPWHYRYFGVGPAEERHEAAIRGE